ncbi:SRPBCC domain-containing protein [Haloprofundus salilacus]|uniref:SRPBCC domain-containing protein n=1 Tax=Haloprofundus salilacus TaxID=2876190 RepID=UPI001CCE1F0A|nr:SRPBCC domain-containing protein [Haloprofundus salilacus]
MTNQDPNAGQSITVSRVIEAPPERVYEAFLDPDDLAQWLPPTGFSAEVHELEPEVGGKFRITFTGDTEEFADYGHSFGGTYKELKPSERIVHTDAFETDDPAMAGEMLVTVTFVAVPDGTEVTVHQERIPENIRTEDATAGWTDSLANLADLVEDSS